MGLVRNCSQQVHLFPSRAVTSGSDVRVWEPADRKQKTRVAARPEIIVLMWSTNSASSFCENYNNYHSTFCILSPGSWAGVSGSGYIITRASSRHVNMLRVQLDTGTGWVAGCLQTLDACPSLPTAHCWHDPSFGRLCWWVWIVNMFVCGPNNGNNNDNYLD